MELKKGYPLPLGVSEREEYVNFSVAVEDGKECFLNLYKKRAAEAKVKIALPKEEAIGEVRFVSLPKAKVKNLEYDYEIAGQIYVDPYAKSVIEQDGVHVRGRVMLENYDWEGDKPLEIPYHKVVAYSLHIKGFTKHASSKVKKKGTFQGIIEKIPYFKELGINQIQCMPVYSFAESKKYQNYWGYGEAFSFAVKNAYAAGKSAENELKDMIKACHQSGIEVVLNLPFTQSVPKQLIIDCLRYYVMEYHIDGFILNPYVAPMDSIYSEPILKKTKILQNKDDFQYVMRRFLRGDEGMVEGVMWWLKQQTQQIGSCNYITNHTGFTLADLVSYGKKHNEANGENNSDGPDYNCSWNCGAEGPTQDNAIVALRKRQIKNALCLLLFAQGTPCLLAGDEFGNSQLGNNNAYCQDNEISWLNWNDLKKEEELFLYVKQLIKLRKDYLSADEAEGLSGVDRFNCGVPDISYHGENAWQAPISSDSRHLGVYYHDEKKETKDCFVAYNMYCEKQKFALPSLPKGKIWHRIFSTSEHVNVPEEILEKEIMIDERTVTMFVGR